MKRRYCYFDFETDAAAAYVRTENGKVAKACLAGGTRLTRAGETIPAEIRKIEDLSEAEARHVF